MLNIELSLSNQNLSSGAMRSFGWAYFKNYSGMLIGSDFYLEFKYASYFYDGLDSMFNNQSRIIFDDAPHFEILVHAMINQFGTCPHFRKAIQQEHNNLTQIIYNDLMTLQRESLGQTGKKYDVAWDAFRKFSGVPDNVWNQSLDKIDSKGEGVYFAESNIHSAIENNLSSANEHFIIDFSDAIAKTKLRTSSKNSTRVMSKTDMEKIYEGLEHTVKHLLGFRVAEALLDIYKQVIPEYDLQPRIVDPNLNLIKNGKIGNRNGNSVLVANDELPHTWIREELEQRENIIKKLRDHFRLSREGILYYPADLGGETLYSKKEILNGNWRKPTFTIASKSRKNSTIAS